MKRAVEVAGIADLVLTAWWVVTRHGLPGWPDLGPLGAPAPGWLLAVLWLVVAAALAMVATMVGLCVQSQLER